MYIGGSLTLIAIGAILKYGVADSIDGINLSAIGLILMVVGVIGLAASLVQTAMMRQRRPIAAHDTTVVDRGVDRVEYR